MNQNPFSIFNVVTREPIEHMELGAAPFLSFWVGESSPVFFEGILMPFINKAFGKDLWLVSFKHDLTTQKRVFQANIVIVYISIIKEKITIFLLISVSFCISKKKKSH